MMQKLPNLLYLGHASYVCSTVLLDQEMCSSKYVYIKEEFLIHLSHKRDIIYNYLVSFIIYSKQEYGHSKR